MAWLGIIISYLRRYTRAHIFGLDPFYPTTLYAREKPFGQRWDRTRLASSASEHSVHYAFTSRASRCTVRSGENWQDWVSHRRTYWEKLWVAVCWTVVKQTQSYLEVVSWNPTACWFFKILSLQQRVLPNRSLGQRCNSTVIQWRKYAYLGSMVQF